MKKILIGILTISTILTSCSRIETLEFSETQKVVTISASFDDTKATYTEAGIFSWESGDEIHYILKHTDGHYDGNALSTTGTGSTATFTGSTSATNFSAVDLALYPKNRNQTPSGVNANTFAVVTSGTTLKASLAESITARDDRLSRIIPMIGVKTGSDLAGTIDKYHFYSVTGVLKLSIKSIPEGADRIVLTVPSDTYAISGTYNIDTERGTPEIKETDCAGTKGTTKELIFTRNASDDVFYIPIPTGTIPAGKLTIAVKNGSTTLYSVTNKKDIAMVRGEITALPDITIPSLKIKISGTADNPKATFYYSGDISTVRYFIDTKYAQLLSSDPSVSSGQTINLTKSETNYYYLNYVAYNSSGDAIRGTESAPLCVNYYAITGDDATALVGNFTHTVAAGCVAGGSNAPSTSNFTIAVSDDPTLGQVMVTNFDGMDCVNKVPGIYNSGTTTISWDNYNTYFDPNEPYKRFVRSSSVATKLNFVFTSTTTFYADSGFGYKTGINDAGGWQYYYNAGSEHIYTKE